MSSSSSAATAPPAREIEDILKKVAQESRPPGDGDLFPAFSFLLPAAASVISSGASSSSFPPLASNTHWYCSKAPTPLHKEAATFLIFLFAFRRNVASAYWVESLETVLASCNSCARAFGGARRTLVRKWLAHFPPQNIARFTEVIDTWQAKFIAKELERTRETFGVDSVSNLPTSFLQLLFNEPGLLSKDDLPQNAQGAATNAELASAVEDLSSTLDKDIAATRGPSAFSAMGLTPVMVALLASPNERRSTWAREQVGYITRPTGFEEWCESGIGSDVQSFLLSTFSGGAARNWASLKVIISEDRLQLETVQRGLLEGQFDTGPARADRSIMSLVARLLGSPSDTFPLVFDCFTTLLRLSPTRHIWAFNTSPELPHTLFSDIKKNSAFQALVINAHPSETPDAKGKGKAGTNDTGNSLEWITNYLVSTVDGNDKGTEGGGGFAEALAKAINFCFNEMQHDRLSIPARTAAAKAGCQAIATLQGKLKSNEVALTALSSTTEVHAAFITTTAFQHNEDPSWKVPRAAARNLLSVVFKADGRRIIESVLGLATIAYHERRRLRRKRRTTVPDPIRVDDLHKVSIRRDLWTMAYNALSPTDASGVALMMSAVAPFAHLEVLDRRNAWNPQDLQLVVKSEDWIESVRAINQALDVTRKRFAVALESVAAQPDPTILKALWEEDGIAKAATMLLLSPADAINEPMRSLIQQSFEDVDDREDCFRVLLAKFPSQAMDGLRDFLSTFISTAGRVPEACSLAKWLVRCFTDVLDVLCQPSGLSPPLLQSEPFLSNFADGKWMTRRVSDLWQLMTDSLALIFKRTADWAPYYDNEVMVDWMRDALIFGRGITDHIRIFESAILSRTKAVDGNEAKMTHVGKSLVQKLEVVLADLVGWLRLTDVETLHQTYELIKTIMGRIGKSNPDLSTDSALVNTLLELDKFCRRAGSSYNCRLSDDLLSELSDLLDAFDLPLRDDDDVQVGKTTRPTSVTRSATPPSTADRSRTVTKAPIKTAPKTTDRTADKNKSAAPQKNAFAVMMKKAGGNYVAGPTKPKAPPKPRQMTLEEFEEDNLLDNLSAGDLDILERRAQAQQHIKKPFAKPKQPSAKMNINVVPKLYPTKPPASKFKSNFMRDLAAEHKAHMNEMRKALPPRLPEASKLGSGLGAYTGPPKPVQKPAPSSDTSSASESSSEDENKGIGGLVNRQKKAPLMPTTRYIAPEPRIKVLGGPTFAEKERERENARRRARNIKLRLRPDITPLFRFVLAWDPEARGSRPPYPPQVAAELGVPRPVPTSFIGAEQYEKIMQPLFLQELWAQFLKDDLSQAIPCEIAVGRSFDDEWIDIEVMVAGNVPQGFSLNDADIVTITLNGEKPIFAKVETYRRRAKEVGIKLRYIRSSDKLGMVAKAKLQLRKHASLSTALREFAALKGLPYYDDFLLRDILSAKSAAMPFLSEGDVRSAMKNYNVNEPQAKAILGALSVKGFALIQGPPGTGKTKTISGLVGKFLSERKAPISVGNQPPQKAKLLVCAPSNAAIDEVCKRLMDGVPTATGGRTVPNIVRVGVESSVNIAVKDISLDNIVESRVNAQSGGKDTGTELARIQAELDEVKQLVKDKQDQIAKLQGNDQKRRELEEEFHALNARRTKLGQQSSKAKDAARDATRHLDGARRAEREAVLKEADVICSTLSGAGQDVLAQYTFETVIIDEAAQAIEMSCLIPLKYGCQRCIMVGDPNQLPPTTFSQEAEQMKFNQSLFVRIAENKGSHMHLLSIQYRMNPEISELPSKIFYQGRLKDGPNMAEKTAAVWHRREAFGPYRFFNVNGQEVKQGTSTKNVDEARVAVDLYRNLNAQFHTQVNLTMRIGVITMYREQLYELRRQFTDAFGPEILEIIEFNTVDGFQGQEKDIIILSCVRSGPNLQHIGFLKDFRRMNVALTRAKSSLFVIGNAATLERSESDWKAIVRDARERGCLINYNKDTFRSSKEAAPKPKARKPSPEANSIIPKVLPCPPTKRAPDSSGSDDGPPEKRVKATNGRPVAAAGRTPPPPPPGDRPSSPPSPPGPSSDGPSRPSDPTGLQPRPPPGATGPNVRPPPGGNVRPPPRPAPRAAEDVLFMKKKRPGPRPPPSGPVGNVRAAYNQHLAGGKRN